MNQTRERNTVAVAEATRNTVAPLPAASILCVLFSMVAVTLGTTVGVTVPVWLGDAAPLISGLMIGLGTVGIAIGSFLEVLRINRN